MINAGGVMSDREKALCAQADIERIMRASGLPFVCIILMPDENGCSRSHGGMKTPYFAKNRKVASVAFLGLMGQLEEGGGGQPNGE